MHTTHPDLVAIKTAVRHMATRLDNDATAAGHWAALAKSRGVDEVVAPLEGVGAALREAVANAEAAVKLLFDAQEREVDDGHHHQ
jgi:hypothetical protein